MADKILLVQNDTNPRLVFNVTDSNTGGPVNLEGCTVYFQFVAAGAAQGTITARTQCVLMVGYRDQYGDIVATPPYDVPGAGGRCYMDWDDVDQPLALAAPGNYLGTLQIYGPDGVRRMTIYTPQKFTVRPEF